MRGRGSRWWLLAALASSLGTGSALAQAHCAAGVRVDGVVVDPNGSSLPAARVRSTDGSETVTDAAGHFLLPCVAAGSGEITTEADGFAPNAMAVEKNAGDSLHLTVQMQLARVETDVQVGEDSTTIDADHGAGTTELNTKDVQQLADDPDDFARQLQILAATSGGSPGSATISVDGFQNGSALPPKSSIASIRVNPDMFSAEYVDPPYDGGRIEIFTKPGAASYHGALFYIDSEGSFNATDPFSVAATPASKRRYGFELSGPVVPKVADFSLALEKRDINEFNIVRAETLGADGSVVPLNQTVPAPQRLWIASARGDWQVTPKDVATLSFSANTNNLGNQGVGGLTLEEAGYGSLQDEYDLRLTNTQTFSANLLHETHIGYTWKRTEDTPTLTAAALNVAGFFNGGGSTAGALNNRERDLEIDDDALITAGRHSWKVGAQSLGIFIHDYDPDTFNGVFLFGGGSDMAAGAPVGGAAVNLSPIQQYQLALAGQPGGTPTTYQQNSGSPLVPLTQWRLALYAQDTIKLQQRFTVSAGLRYALQTSPGSYNNFDPRIGFAWAPDKKSKTVIHVRAGLFSSINPQAEATQVYRLNGVRQNEALVYSPSFLTPLTPIAGSAQVSTIEQFPHGLTQSSSFQGQLGVEHDFPHHWHAQVNWYTGNAWNDVRQRNINAPLVASSGSVVPSPTEALLAPRPLAPNLNILQFQNTGHLSGDVLFFGLDQHSYKRFGFFAGDVYMNFSADTGRGAVIPQSTYTNAGEFARPDWQRTNQFFMFGNLNLPRKVELDLQLDAESGNPYNVITGTDANGDGDFNDRPAYAVPGSAGTPGVYATRFGLLSTNTVNGDVPRNLGTMPSTLHMDMNLSRSFKLGSGKESPRAIAFNARSANILNHTNVTAVNTIVSSGALGESVAASAARRLELGTRFSF